jgi:SAM-dependent methyltransferase
MAYEKFDIRKLERLNDPARFEQLDPAFMWAALGRPSPRTIVEIGAGTGMFAARFLSLAPGSVLHAVDLEPAMVEWMNANRPEAADGRLVPILGDETRVPLDDGIADLVFMVNLHHELADPAATYGEALRVLRSGGQVLVVDWAPIETPHGPPMAVRASADELATALTEVGFADVLSHSGLPWHSVVTAVRP